MSNISGRDWFPRDKQPFEWSAESWQQASEESTEDFEYTLRFPLPADKVIQTVKIVKGQLVLEFSFVFSDPEIFDAGEE